MADQPTTHSDPTKLIQSAQDFFLTCPKEKVPPVLHSKGTWTVLRGGWFWALFYVTEPSLRRIREYQAKKWHPFPGLFSPDETGPVLIATDGKDGLFDSNITENGYGFRVGRNATFILHNHRQIITDETGNKAEYQVELAFVVGENAAREYGSIENAFLHLFKYLVQIWGAKR